MRASRKLLSAGSLMTAYPPELLRGLLGPGGLLSSLWTDGHVAVNDVWDAFARYPYLPRLRDIDILARTVAGGPASVVWESHGFAVADAYKPESGRHVGLVTGGMADGVVGTTLIVAPELASVQLAADAAVVAAVSGSGTGGRGGIGGGGSLDAEDGGVPGAGQSGSAVVDDRLRRFYAVARLDPERYQRDFAKLAAEVVANLVGLLGTEVEISVEVRATNEAGFPDGLVRTVTENARRSRSMSTGSSRSEAPERAIPAAHGDVPLRVPGRPGDSGAGTRWVA